MSPFIHCSLDLRLHLAKLDLVDAGANIFKTNLDNVSVLEPQLRLASHSNTLRPSFFRQYQQRDKESWVLPLTFR